MDTILGLQNTTVKELTGHLDWGCKEAEPGIYQSYSAFQGGNYISVVGKIGKIGISRMGRLLSIPAWVGGCLDTRLFCGCYIRTYASETTYG